MLAHLWQHIVNRLDPPQPPPADLARIGCHLTQPGARAPRSTGIARTFDGDLADFFTEVPRELKSPGCALLE